MDERLVLLLKGINVALTEFLTTVEKTESPIKVDKVAVAPEPVVETPVVEVTPEAIALPVDPEASQDVSSNIVPPPDVVPVEANTIEPAVEYVSPEFPLAPQQVMKAKRKDLRDLVEQLNIPITGPNGESASELMVGPLREAIIGYIRLQAVGAAPAVKLDSSDATVTPVEAVPNPPTSDPAVARKVDTFLAWVSEQSAGGGRVAKAEELATFFSEHLPHLQGESREPVDKYFSKLGCSASCSQCPNGPSQPVFCYGIFDEEVPGFNLDDAVSADQYFKCTPTGDLAHRPS